ncbi:MAG: hypothetical protein AAGI68_12695 [Planctomycetota bacterium]
MTKPVLILNELEQRTATHDRLDGLASGLAGLSVELLVQSHPQGARLQTVTVSLPREGKEVVIPVENARIAGSLVIGHDATVGVNFKVISGTLARASVGLRLAFEDWSTRMYVTMPGAVYGSNRLDRTGSWHAGQIPDRGADPVPNQTPQVPALEVGGGGCVEQLAGDMSVPAVAVYDPREGRGLIVATPQRAAGAARDTGFRLTESDDAETASIEVLASLVRQGEKRPGVPCRDTGQDLEVGDSITLTLLCRSFEAQSPADVHRRLMELRPDISFTRSATPAPLLPREVLPFSAAWSIQHRKFNEQNWVEKYGYYSVGMRECASQDWQTGWVGGCNTAYALLADGDALTCRRATRVFDFLLTARLPSGFVGCGFHEGRWGRERVFLRHQADALFFLTKALLLMRERGEKISADRLRMVQGLAEAFGTMWARDGQLGQFADPDSGELLIGRSCAAGLAPAGLLLAAELFERDDYRRNAEQVADYYLTRFTREAFTNGGPGDIAQAHDSESAFALLTSYTALLEATGDTRWANAARDAAAQAASYVMPYDFAFPEDSTFGRLGMRTRGTVFANVQNKHSAPGICTLSGVSLLRLARATGERCWLDLLADIAGAIPQYMSREDRPIRDRRPNQPWPVMPAGWINERVNTSDWEVRGDPDEEIGVGEIFGGSTWSEAAMLLTRVELPGVYVHLDRGWCVALDHVRATVEDDQLVIENPTPFPARVKLLIEDHPSAQQPLGPNPLAGEPGVPVDAHQTIRLPLKPA